MCLPVSLDKGKEGSGEKIGPHATNVSSASRSFGECLMLKTSAYLIMI